MKFEINVNEYLSEDEMKEIAKEAVKDSFKEKLKSEEDMKRILDNQAYHHIHGEVEKIIPNHIDLIKRKVVNLLNNEKFYDGHIFKSKDEYFTTKDSLAKQILNQQVKDSQDLIKQNVVKAIQDRDYDSDISDSIQSTADELCNNIYKLGELLSNSK